MKELGQFFSKNIVTLAIIAGVIFLVYMFRGAFGNIIDYLNLRGEKKEKQSKSDDALKQIAEMQDAAMNEVGTNETLLFKSLEGLNGTDLQKVFNYFGTRKYFLGTRDDILGHKINLFLWYTSELSGNDLKKMKEIWNKSGLEITF